jgi:hypothetical protein
MPFGNVLGDAAEEALIFRRNVDNKYIRFIELARKAISRSIQYVENLSKFICIYTLNSMYMHLNFNKSRICFMGRREKYTCHLGIRFIVLFHQVVLFMLIPTELQGRVSLNCLGTSLHQVSCQDLIRKRSCGAHSKRHVSRLGQDYNLAVGRPGLCGA